MADIIRIATDILDERDNHPALVRARAITVSHIRALFPQTYKEAQVWEPRTLYKALAPRVIVVAVPRIECAWAAYIDAVPGVNHYQERDNVSAHGEKLAEPLARLLFPAFADVAYAD